MNPRRASVVASLVLAPVAAHAGGLYLPGAGAVSTARAGAAVASASDGEALVVNPAGLAKTKGTTITVSAAIIDYAFEFTRRGTYDQIENDTLAYEGDAFPTVKNDVSPPLGLGSYQPVPVIAVVSDLNGAIDHLTVAAGLYAPNAYPFRDLCTQTSSGCKHFEFNADFNEPPPPSRYDIIKQEASVLVPTIAVAYEVLPELDIGARFGLGFAKVKSTVALWAAIDNYAEYVKQDSVFTLDASSNFMPAWGIGATYRPTPFIELGFNYSSWITVNAKGSAVAENGPEATLNGTPIVLRASDNPRCESGGTADVQRGCVGFQLPMSATLGGRYKFLDANGAEKGDIELNVGWENWGADKASNYRVVVDSDVYLKFADNTEMRQFSLSDSYVRHGFRDTFNARLGGSYHIPAGSSGDVIVRGGLGYDTAAAKQGWLRADLDGAARTTITAGAGYRAKRFEVNIGGGVILEGTNNNPGTCNPTGLDGTPAVLGCGPSGSEQTVEDRNGPDPITPAVDPENQTESPISQGNVTSHYVLLMLGFSTWF